MQIVPTQLGILVEYISKEEYGIEEQSGPHLLGKPIKSFDLSDTICPLTTKTIAELFVQQEKSFPYKDYLIAMDKEGDTEVLYDGTTAVNRYFSSEGKALTAGKLRFFMHNPRWDKKDKESTRTYFTLVETIRPGGDKEKRTCMERVLKSLDPSEKGFPYRVELLSSFPLTDKEERDKNKCTEEAEDIKKKYKDKEMPAFLADALKKYNDIPFME